MVMEKIAFNSVEEWFCWKLDYNFLKTKNLKKINYPSVESANLSLTTVDKTVSHSLKWDNTDVLYSFLLMYYLGLKVIDPEFFDKLFKMRKDTMRNPRLQPFSSCFLFECSRYKEFQELNECEEIKQFLELYFSIGNVIPIWPGGNEARGKMGIYDIPELFFNKYPKWTEELKRQYTNSHLDIVVNNKLFLVSHEKENGWNIKGYKGAFSNLKEFITLIEKDKNFYFDYLRRRNKIIKLREQSLLDELSQL